MPNRILKESVCTSETIDGLTWFEEVFFYRLIVNCDDYGRMDARPAILRSRLFPLKSVTDKQVGDALNKLAAAGIVQIYEYENRTFLQLVTWEKHQQIRAKKSRFPAPDSACNHVIADDIKCPRNPIQSESESNTLLSPPMAAVNKFFESIWKLYPKKEGKGKVSDARKKKLFAIGFDEISRTIERYKAKLEAEGTEPRFIQMGSTFFNSGYVDYLDENYTQEQAKGKYDDAY